MAKREYCVKISVTLLMNIRLRQTLKEDNEDILLIFINGILRVCLSFV